MSLYEDLMWRGLIKDSAGDIKELFDKGNFTFYWGTDPTADSLHIGHYSSLVTAKRLAKAGNHPILLVGGATALIGDPRPNKEREIIQRETVEKNILGIKNQITKLFDNNVLVVNNYDWIKDISIIDFLRDTGKYININYMLDKDIIRRRLETGITFAEFTYTLLQGYDYLYLNKNNNCVLQAAGSDQWGNITTGIELIKKVTDKEVYGFTMPLVLDKSGEKFGKSMGNALWLDINKTSAYELYQYLVNSDDSLVIDYLKIFTFLSKEEIEKLEESNKKEPELRLAHKRLAKEIIIDIHGIEEYEKALLISESLFTDKINTLSAEDIIKSFGGVPTFEIVNEENIVDFLVNNNIVTSKREAREMISGNAISINNKKITDLNYIITKADAISEKVLLIKKGKKMYYIGLFI